MNTPSDVNAIACQRVARARRPTSVATPEWVNRLADPDRMAELIVERHIDKQGPVWGLAKFDPDQDLAYDEIGSARVVSLANRYNLYEKIGGFNRSAKQEIIRFWQSWQNPATGRFADPRDPAREVNEKYIVALLAELGVKPLYPFAFTGHEGRVDTKVFLRRTQDDPDWAKGGWGAGSHTGFMACEIFRAICDNERADLIPDFEEGVERMLCHQSADGLWGPPTAPLDGRIGGTLKVVDRLYFQLGMMIPRAEEIADALIMHERNGDWFKCSLNYCIPRNVTEMLGFCLETMESRREDLFLAMESNLEHHRAHVNPDGSWSSERGQGRGGISEGEYSFGAIGGYLNWEDCRFQNPVVRWPLTRGSQFPYRIEVLQGGQVRMVKKE